MNVEAGPRIPEGDAARAPSGTWAHAGAAGPAVGHALPAAQPRLDTS